jgi:hypothetical protein
MKMRKQVFYGAVVVKLLATDNDHSRIFRISGKKMPGFSITGVGIFLLKMERILPQ